MTWGQFGSELGWTLDSHVATFRTITSVSAELEKPLLARIFVMYAVAATVNLISSFERSRWRAALERERELQRERIELSQAIHDTAAQTAFMIGLGIDAAKQVAGDANEELTARLEATSRLSKTAVWQLRHPIDMGRIFEGSELGWTLDSHVATFRTITSVSAELAQNGVEPPLSVEVRLTAIQPHLKDGSTDGQIRPWWHRSQSTHGNHRRKQPTKCFAVTNLRVLRSGLLRGSAFGDPPSPAAAGEPDVHVPPSPLGE